MSQPQYVYFQISIGGIIQPQLIVIELDVQTYPKTCHSFIKLCTSPLTTTRSCPQPTYRGCEFHRIVPNLCVQTGDFECFDGSGGYSPIYGKHFEDEIPITTTTTTNEQSQPLPILRKHNVEGIVSMANTGKKNTNGSQWFITLKPVPHLDGKHVPFGKVVVVVGPEGRGERGMETIYSMVSVDRDSRDRPVGLQKILIVDCGVGRGEAITTIQPKEPKSSTMQVDKTEKRRHMNDDDDDDDEGEIERNHRHRKRRRQQEDDNYSASVERSDYSGNSSSSSESSSSSAHRRRRRRRKRQRKEEKKMKRKKKEKKKDRKGPKTRKKT
jgi:peptidyl-prolyl isomerase G (cyclophilin G)